MEGDRKLESRTSYGCAARPHVSGAMGRRRAHLQRPATKLATSSARAAMAGSDSAESPPAGLALRWRLLPGRSPAAGDCVGHSAPIAAVSPARSYGLRSFPSADPSSSFRSLTKSSRRLLRVPTLPAKAEMASAASCLQERQRLISQEWQSQLDCGPVPRRGETGCC